MFEFPCPHCSVPLRVRDTGMKGRTIPCPDCGEPVAIREANGALYGAVEEESPFSRNFPPPSPLPPLLSRLLITGTVVALLLVVFVISSRRGGPEEPREKAVAADPQEAEERRKKEEEPPPPDPQQQPEPPPLSPVEARLKGIYGSISEHHAAEEMFPQGTSGKGRPEERFSWIARLASQEGTRRPNWDQPWNAPVNDEFVRRRLPEFENPHIEQGAGEDRYPASHFVGVTGVGADAARLPKRHPRAGIFGENRQTRVEDVTDGLANTMMVAGVHRQLGSWGRSGKATMRGFAEEPYVNGPDGFGTGQEEGMYVLMADGSVRFLSARTDPVVIRRMAAMADGLPLDSSVPGDPLAMEMEPAPPADPEPQIEAERPAIDEGPPIEVLLANDIPPFDIEKSLTQKLVGFSQSEPTPLETLLSELEELIGAPIDFSGISEEAQQLEVSLELEEITLGEILSELTGAAGVRFEVTEGRIEIQPEKRE